MPKRGKNKCQGQIVQSDQVVCIDKGWDTPTRLSFVNYTANLSTGSACAKMYSFLNHCQPFAVKL